MGKKWLKNQAARANVLKGQSQTIPAEKAPPELCLSFKYFDSRQGQNFIEWEQDGLLSKALEKWRDYCRKTLRDCTRENHFTSYGRVPSHSEFIHPDHIPPDAEWASMHVQGKECVVGHIVGQVFYVVFLDRHHKFWPTEKKNT